MSVAHSAFRGAAWTVLTSVGSRGVSLVGTFILTHFLNPDVVGEVNVAFVAVLTASFLSHIGFGHYVEGDSWAELLDNYDVTVGNLWILILLWIAAGPATVRAIAAKRAA